MKKVLLLIFSFIFFISYSQVGIGTNSPDVNAELDIESNSKGVLFPRLTDAQRDAIIDPAEGLYIYNLDSHRFEYFNGTFWMALAAIKVDTPDLFISEYSEPTSGNGSDKYIEIYNPNSVPVILTGAYTITVYFNGASSGTTVNLIGTVAANDVFVLYKNGANATIIAQGDQSTIDLNYNGNDAVELKKSGVTIDQIGIVGVDPGNGWDVAGIADATEENVLKRKSGVTIGNTDWVSSAGTNTTDSEWTVLPAGDFSDLGSHTP